MGLLVLGALGVYLAGRVVEAWMLAGAPARPGTILPGPGTRPAGIEDANDPLGAVGLVPRDADPRGIPPAPGARRVTSFQRVRGDETEQQARYEVFAAADAVVSHYRRELESRGYRLLKDTRDARGRRVVVFDEGSRWATLGLRADRPNARMVTVILTVVFSTGTDSESTR